MINDIDTLPGQINFILSLQENLINKNISPLSIIESSLRSNNNETRNLSVLIPAYNEAEELLAL